MPIPFKGTITGTVTSPAYNLPFNIGYFTIVNTNNGTTIVNLYVSDGVNDILLMGKDVQMSEGDFCEGNFEQIMEAGSSIKLVTDNPVDFYFTIDNIQPPA